MGLRREEQANREIGREEQEYLLIDPVSGSLHAHDDPLFARDALILDEQVREFRPSPWIVAGKALLVVASIAWTGFAAYLLAARGFRMPGLEQVPTAAAGFCAPLILLGLLYMMLSRSSYGEADRFARVATQLRNEAEALDMRLALVNQQLETAREHMHDQASLLEHYGGSASLNLEAAAKNLAQHASTSAQQSEIIERAGLSLAHQFGQLIEAMPILEDRAGRISSTLVDGSETLVDKVERLEARLEAMTRLIEEARSRTANATQSLTAQLMQIQDATRTASDEVSGLADLSANRVAAAIGEARGALEEIGMTLDVRAADLGSLVKESRIAFENLGAEAITTYDVNIAQLEGRLRGLDEIVIGQSNAITTIGEELGNHVSRITEDFERLEKQSVSGSEQMSRALDELARRTLELDEALQSGNRTAEAMISRSESLLVALDASVRELDEGHPAALARLDEKLGQSHRLLGAITPEIEQLEAISAAIVGRAKEAEDLLGGQGRKLSEWLDRGEHSLASCQEQVTALQQAMEAADGDARRLADSSGPQLVATLLRVKEMAEQAGEKARQALSKAIAEATNELGEASEAALSERLGETFKGRIEEIGALSDQAVRAAHAASDRLMRQLITIADTTAAIEQRIAEADDAAERRDQDNFSRQSSTLIEALNSASIDVSRFLGEDVSDSSWAAYLKGDRGVFTRRAVRLLDNDRAAAINGLYQSNDAFRETTNRYIHDFEAMLRVILAARDGTSLGVTLLSSDMGKLYVALAQATERLKN